MKKHIQFSLILAFLLPAAYFVLTVLVFPRPYYFHVTDLEQGYYYGPKLIQDGNPVLAIDHPGTPIYMLGSLIMRLTGDGVAQTQAYFNAGYLAVALANMIALVLLARLVLKDAPPGLAALAMVSAMIHPAWMTYTYTFGADAFVAPASIALLSVYWHSLGLPGRRAGLWALTGALAGLSLAIKFTTIPVVIAVLAGSWWSLIRAAPGGRRPGPGWYLLIPGATLLSFLLFVSPTFPRIPQIFINLFLREEGAPSFALNVLLGNLKPALASPTAALSYLFLAALGIWVLARIAKQILTSGKIPSALLKVDDRAVLLGLLVAAFGYLFLSGILRKGWDVYLAVPTPYLLDPGVFFRNILPISLFGPFALAYLRPARPARGDAWRGALALALLAVGWGGHLSHRAGMIAYERDRLALTEPALQAETLPGTRMAVWDGSPGDILGEASFHFWGNYAYAQDYYDAQLLADFPGYTLLKLREVYPLIAPAPEEDDPDSLLGRWKRLFPSPYYLPRGNDFVTGEAAGAAVSLIALPAQEVSIEGISSSDLQAILAQRFGEFTTSRKIIGDVDWLLIHIAPPR